jgi:hypothetical protein
VLTKLNCLEHEWNDGFALLWVVFEFFLVVAVFSKGPHGHLVHTGCSEEVSWQALSHDGERQPRAELVSVVGAWNEVEETSQRVGVGNWNLANGCAGRAKVAQVDVNREITKLAQLKGKCVKKILKTVQFAVYQECSESTIDNCQAWRSVKRMIDVIGDIGSESPIVSAVLEQVGQWHCCVREPMDKDSFEQTLYIVNCIASGGDAKKNGKWRVKLFSPKPSAVKVQLTALLCWSELWFLHKRATAVGTPTSKQGVDQRIPQETLMIRMNIREVFLFNFRVTHLSTSRFEVPSP